MASRLRASPARHPPTRPLPLHDAPTIAFYSTIEGQSDIFVINADGSGESNLTSNPDGGDFGLDWSPDGSCIAFTSDRDGDREIYVMNADGSAQTRLTDRAGDDGFPRWSPDGTKILFRFGRPAFDVFVMNADGSGQIIALLLVACGLLLMLLMACSSHGGDDGAELPDTSVVAAVDRVYKFDAAGSLPLADRSELPVDPGAVTARWYTFRGWYVAVFEDLDLEALGPLCLGTSVFNPTANQLEHAFTSPTAEGACDDAGTGVAVPLARGNTGVRACGGLVSYVTNIPADLDGVLFATLTVFPGDGTGVAIMGRVESTIGPLGEIDAAKLRCGPAMRPPTPEPTVAPTPAPASSGNVATAERVPPPSPREPENCVPPLKRTSCTRF